MRLLIRRCVLMVYAGWVRVACAEDLPVFEAHGVLDARYVHSATGSSWWEGGLDKSRYSGPADLLRVNSAALALRARLGWDWSAVATLRYADGQTQAVDASEAFLAYRPASLTAWRFGARVGAFFPPVSLENTGTAWTSPHTLSSSAINSWVGEELRIFGGEGQATYRRDTGDQISGFGGVFANNDTAGTLLAWRGWALHDHQATFGDRLALPALNGHIQQFFPEQALATEPVVEVDGRPGYYLGFTLERPALGKFRAMYYDNRGQTAALRQGLYAWHTRFVSLGARLELPWDMVFIGQGLVGNTEMGAASGGRFPVDVDFQAWSLLLGKSWGAHRVSLRYERFGTTDHDLLPQDPNRETGHALTCNYNYNLTWVVQHQFNLEWLHIASDRPARRLVGETAAQTENLWLLSYRVFF